MHGVSTGRAASSVIKWAIIRMRQNAPFMQDDVVSRIKSVGDGFDCVPACLRRASWQCAAQWRANARTASTRAGNICHFICQITQKEHHSTYSQSRSQSIIYSTIIITWWKRIQLVPRRTTCALPPTANSLTAGTSSRATQKRPWRWKCPTTCGRKTARPRRRPRKLQTVGSLSVLDLPWCA